MAQAETIRRCRRGCVLTAAFVFAVVVLPGCTDADKVADLGDPCVKDDQCQAGRCDEQVCKAQNPLGPGEECQHPLECRSESCVMRLENDRWRARCGPGIRPLGTECTDDLQCTPEPDPAAREHTPLDRVQLTNEPPVSGQHDVAALQLA